MKEWSEFNKFSDVDEKYLPIRGEGDTKASQITTAVCKLVYKWFNDGDVFDNTGELEGWANDISDFANWLYTHCHEAKEVFDKRWFDEGVYNDSDYEDLLYELCEKTQNMEILKKYEVPSEGTVYDCRGPFEFKEA